jgi:hypothetical protein
MHTSKWCPPQGNPKKLTIVGSKEATQGPPSRTRAPTVSDSDDDFSETRNELPSGMASIRGESAWRNPIPRPAEIMGTDGAALLDIMQQEDECPGSDIPDDPETILELSCCGPIDVVV